MINILKASAGSGKTYNLAKTYLRLLFESENRRQYRHILAVTFTNKATAEMKSRILKELHQLAVSPEESPYLRDFVPSFFSSPYELKNKAEEVLVDLLHDYSAFSVSTIDKFFQQTLKAFAREIGQFSAYQVELDKNSLIRESVDRILDSLTEDDSELMSWLNDNVMNQLEKGSRVKIEAGLYEMAGLLKSEEFRSIAESRKISCAESFSRDKLVTIRKECVRIIREFKQKLMAAAREVAAVLESTGVPASESNRGFLKAVYSYTDDSLLRADAKLLRPTDAFFLKASDDEQWFAKKKKDVFMPMLGAALHGPLDEFCSLFGREYRLYQTAVLLREQTFTLGIASVVYGEFDALLKEKNVLSLDDSNSILHRIIDGSDAPFVYEKLGVRFEHFLLDEFQDTSTIQWENFRPLLAESDSNGRQNLVVGDVKQSIYRWRGSDWSLLGYEVAQTFPDSCETALDSNYRSTAAVVDFNNHFFRYAAEVLALDGIYSDVAQSVKTKDAQQGSVGCSFCETENILPLVCDSIRDAVGRNARYGDMAVLVRNNSEGGRIAAELIKEGIPVISDDSLDTKSSLTVRRLVSILSCVDNPSDEVGGYMAASLGVDIPSKYHSLLDLCEGILRSLHLYDSVSFDGEVLFIQSFMDTLKDWSSVNGQNLGQFINYWKDNSFHISSPADPDAVRVMTIHKSKGLEFPYIIFPYAEKVDLYKPSVRWSPLDGSIEGFSASGGIFPVNLSSSSADTFFSGSYEEERFLQKVDNLNVFYVACTRASKELHVISSLPSASFYKSLEKGEPEFKNMSHILYAFTNSTRTYGSKYDYSLLKRKPCSEERLFAASYPSFALNLSGDKPLSRLVLSSDSSDFFSENGQAGVEASARLNGIVLHGIMSKVNSVRDLLPAVGDAVANGMLSIDEGKRAVGFLTARMQAALSRGWFSVANALNEVEIIDDKGDYCRPDRVEISDHSVLVIDYKFARKSPEHVEQVKSYVDVYRKMGYGSVKGCLWYVYEDDVVEIVQP